MAKWKGFNQGHLLQQNAQFQETILLNSPNPSHQYLPRPPEPLDPRALANLMCKKTITLESMSNSDDEKGKTLPSPA